MARGNQPSRNEQVATVDKIQQTKVVLKRDLLPKALPEIRELLPRGMDPDRFIAMAYLAVATNADLANCDPGSIVRSTVQAAVCGLEIGGMLGHGFLVPFKGQCTFMPGYRGMIHLMHAGGGIISGQAHNVYDGDEFDVMLGSEPKIYHRPNFRAERVNDAIMFSYFAGKLTSGETFFRVLTRDEIEKRRAVSKMKDGVTWTQWFEEMTKKTATRASAKEIPVSFQRLAAAVEFDTRVETGRAEHPIPGYEDENAMRVHVQEQTNQTADELRDRVAAQAAEVAARVAAEKAAGGEPEPTGRDITQQAAPQQQGGPKPGPKPADIPAPRQDRTPGEDDEDDVPELTPEQRRAQVAASAGDLFPQQ